MADYTEQLTNKEAMKFIDQVGGLFKTLPHLPANIVEFIVKIVPWLALIGAIFGFIGGPVLGILGSIGSLLTLSPLLMVSTLLTAVVIIIQSILQLMAFNPLKNRQTRGWVLLFWSNMLTVASTVFSVLSGNPESLIGSAIGLLISLYFLFEIRSSYSGKADAKLAA